MQQTSKQKRIQDIKDALRNMNDVNMIDYDNSLTENYVPKQQQHDIRKQVNK